MVKLGSPELGSRFQQMDVTAAKRLADRLIENGNLEQADKVMFQQRQYVAAWNDVINALSGSFPVRVYDENVNLWRDQGTGRFTTNPANDEAFLEAARQARLING